VGVLAPADADVATKGACQEYKLAAIAVTHIILGEGSVTCFFIYSDWGAKPMLP
jgi:hypothetical protein